MAQAFSHTEGIPTSAATTMWADVLERARGDLAETTLVMWFSDVRAASFDGDMLTLSVPSHLVKERLQHQHLAMIEDAAAISAGRPVKIELEVDEALRHADANDAPVLTRREPPARQEPARSAPAAPAPAPSAPSSARPQLGAPGLPFPNYTFDAFVPGPSNRFAHAAAMAVAEAHPSTAYNPLFIYGGVGLGKTHLLIAVGHHMYRLKPSLRVKYVTSETFVTEFIKAVRERQGDAFRHKFREIDVLLVDDIQFLAKREETQTEFFHTFNHLHGSAKQIVIASDRPPHELSGLEERLVSRFRWGLCVDVQPPDLETRIAILQLKAERDGLHTIPHDVIEFVASKFDQSVRELEGALVRVVAWSELTGQSIDQTLAERALQDLIPQNQSEIPPQIILEETANYFSLSTGDLMSKSRSRPLTNARHIAMYLTRECTGLSLVKIGEIFGGRDHTTVLHAINKVTEEMRARDTVFRQVQDLTRSIRARARGAA
jgi:chromosomal replication initiator protein